MKENAEKKNVVFYGGAIGPWIPMGLMIIGIIICTIIGKKGTLNLVLPTFLAYVVGFFLCKDKKNFGDIALRGIQNPMMGTIILAFLLAGMMSQLLRQSGLIQALIWVTSELNLTPAFIPLVSFIVPVLISTSCGTSTGTVAAVSPVLLPLAASLNVDLGLTCGAIISGAIFGDNLAPISDTTIGSALTQEAKVSDVVRTRLPYSLIAAGISSVLFVIFGFRMASSGSDHIVADASSAKALVLLVLPVVMVIMMKKGWSLVSTLIVCNTLGIAINLALGCITPAVMFDTDGPILGGMSGMLNLCLYVILLHQIFEFLSSSNAFESLEKKLLKVCKTPRSGELVCFGIASLGSVACVGSTGAIMSFGKIVRTITKTFHIDRCRGANILDGVACASTGLIPFCNPVIVSLGVAMGIDGVSPEFSFVNIMPYTFHCWALLAIFLFIIITGIGRKFETEE